MGNRPVIVVLFAAIACVAGAVALVRVSRSSAAPKDTGTKVLVATKDIEFGVKIALDGEGANAKFVSWPQQWVPAGAFSSPDEFKPAEGESARVATFAYVKNMPILQKLTAYHDEFFPEGYWLESFPTDRQYATHNLKAGDIVDVVKAVSRPEPHTEPFITCARIYAIGEPPWGRAATQEPAGKDKKKKAPVKTAPVDIHLLLPTTYQNPLFTAKETKGVALRIMLPAGECDGEARLVASSEMAGDAKARSALLDAQALQDGGEHDRAIDMYDEVIADYAAFPDVVLEARAGRAECEKHLATELLVQARKAADQGRKDLFQSVAADARARYPGAQAVLKELADIEQEMAAAEDEKVRRADYIKRCALVKEALENGNLPLAEEQLKAIEAGFGGYAPEELPAAEDVIGTGRAELAKKQADFKIKMDMVEAMAKNKAGSLAAKRFAELKAAFPGHPEVAALEKALQEAGYIE